MDIQLVMKCREDGMTYDEIAAKFNVSRQCVHQTVRAYENFKVKATACVYIGLRNWMNEHKVRVSKLILMCNCNAHSHTMYDYLKGKHDMPKSVIDAILKVTGLTYEQTFGEVSANETVD
jgi:transposase